MEGCKDDQKLFSLGVQHPCIDASTYDCYKVSGINIDDANIVKDHNSRPFVEDVQRNNLLLVKVSTVSHLGSFGVHCVFDICHF